MRLAAVARGRRRADRTRRAAGGDASGLRPVAARRRRRHSLSHDVRGIAPLWRHAGRHRRCALVAVSALTVGLAVREDSQPLAGLAIAGGFLAPILVGRHGEPRSCSAISRVLNGAIFALAWRRAWRALNVRGVRVHVRAGPRLGSRYYVPAAFRHGRAVPLLFFVVLRSDRGALGAPRPVGGAASGRRITGVRRAAGRASRCRPRWCATQGMAQRGARWRWRSSSAVVPRAAAAHGARARVARQGLSRAGGDLRDAGDPVRLRGSVDGGAVGDRSRRRLLDGRAAEGAGSHARSRCWSNSARGSRSSGPASADVDDRLFANAYFTGAMLIALSGLATARIADRAGDALSPVERRLMPIVFGWGVAVVARRGRRRTRARISRARRRRMRCSPG